MAVPGSVFSPLSVGTHALIRDGAGLVQNARDVLAALGVIREVLDDPLAPPRSLGLGLPPGRGGILLHLFAGLRPRRDRVAVLASLGHVRGVPEKEIALDVAAAYSPPYEVVESRRKPINELRAA